MNTTDQIAEALTARLTARRTACAASIAKQLGLPNSTVGRQLAAWTRSREFGFCDAQGGLNSHTHIQFRGEIFAR